MNDTFQASTKAQKFDYRITERKYFYLPRDKALHCLK